MDGGEVRKRRVRASCSFSKDECRWLYAVLREVLTVYQPDVSVLRENAVGKQVAGKILHMLRVAERDAEQPQEVRGRRRVDAPVLEAVPSEAAQ